jgi:hypothetical protein
MAVETETFRLPGGEVTRPILAQALTVLREILVESAARGDDAEAVEELADVALEGMGLTYRERAHVVPRLAREAVEAAEVAAAVEDAYRQGRRHCSSIQVRA